MAAGSWNVLLFLCLTTSFLLSQASAGGGGNHGAVAGWIVPASKSECRGSVAECLENEEEEEFGLNSESSRRILASSQRYISYGALQRNSVPCSRRGASYYNCRPGAQANPYQRSCSAATRCRR